MKTITCNIDEFKSMFMDYRSIMDSIHSKLMDGIHEFEKTLLKKSQIFITCNKDSSLWIKKLQCIGVFEPRERINYDGFSKNCIGLLDGHEVCVKDDLGSNAIFISDKITIDNPDTVMVSLKV